MKKPLIGITSHNERTFTATNLKFVTAVQESGGIPVCLPLMANNDTVAAYAELCDGFLFTGGVDINPALYGEDPHYALEPTSPMRDVTDSKYFDAAYNSGKPILGVCRGIQQINVSLGGTLYQDLGIQYPRPEGVNLLEHSQKTPGYDPVHEVIAEEDSFIAEIYGGTRFAVNSFHHQAVKDVAPGCKVIARAVDGVIEAITKPGYGFLYGLQWHPEMMCTQHEEARRLFDAFVEACTVSK